MGDLLSGTLPSTEWSRNSPEGKLLREILGEDDDK
jgi:hypothetical protein